MTTPKVFVIAWVAVTALVLVLGAPFKVAAVLALVPAIMSAGLVRITRGSGAGNRYTASGEEPITATYASDNIALDLPGRRLWLRDVSGRKLIVDLDHVAAWEHTWSDTTNGYGVRSRIRNELSFRLRQLDIPTVRISFRRHSDAFNGEKNFLEASQWQARLTTLING